MPAEDAKLLERAKTELDHAGETVRRRAFRGALTGAAVQRVHVHLDAAEVLVLRAAPRSTCAVRRRPWSPTCGATWCPATCGARRRSRRCGRSAPAPGRRTRRTRSVPVTLALLKLPLGALTALLGPAAPNTANNPRSSPCLRR